LCQHRSLLRQRDFAAYDLANTVKSINLAQEQLTFCNTLIPDLISKSEYELINKKIELHQRFISKNPSPTIQYIIPQFHHQCRSLYRDKKVD
jgi:hypothetical protein